MDAAEDPACIDSDVERTIWKEWKLNETRVESIAELRIRSCGIPIIVADYQFTDAAAGLTATGDTQKSRRSSAEVSSVAQGIESILPAAWNALQLHTHVTIVSVTRHASDHGIARHRAVCVRATAAILKLRGRALRLRGGADSPALFRENPLRSAERR